MGLAAYVSGIDFFLFWQPEIAGSWRNISEGVDVSALPTVDSRTECFSACFSPAEEAGVD